MTGLDRRRLLTAGAGWAGAALVGAAGPPAAARAAAGPPAAVAGTPVADHSREASSEGAPRGGAVVVAETWLDERTLDLTIRSPALGAVVPVRLLLPDGWSPGPAGSTGPAGSAGRSGSARRSAASAPRRWPVVYLLHGGRDDYTSWTRETDIADLSAAHQVIVAMPEGGRAGFYSDWWNAGLSGPPRWEAFHLTELTQLLERDYGAATARVLAGASSGGQGALVYGARHPGFFRFLASYSGLASNLTPGVPELVMGLLASEGFDPARLWGLPQLHRAVWLAHDATSLAGGLRGTEVYLTCGRVDAPLPSDPADWSDGAVIEAITAWTIPRFVTAARRHLVPLTTHLYPGGTHSWPYWEPELHASWPSMMRALGETVGH
jgi:S-formylglutathione hydrolase FrmB